MPRPTPILVAFLLALSSALIGAPTAAAPTERREAPPDGHAAIDTPRIAGSDRYATAAEVSRQFFPDGAATVFVATGATYPDALAAGPAARARSASLLLTRPGYVPAATANEIARLGPDEIIVVGGPAAVSETVRVELATMAPGGATRVGGDDRYETAALLAATFFAPGTTVFIATGETFPDGLAAGAAAAAVNGALLLVSHDTVPAGTAAQLDRLGPDYIYIAGLTGAVSASVESQLSAYGTVIRAGGQDRYATAAEISKAIYPNGSGRAFVATGESFADALAASPPAGMLEGPMLLTPRWWLPASIRDEIVRVEPDTGWIIGGTGAISAGVENEVAEVGAIGCTAGGKPPIGGVQVFNSIPGATGKVALTFDMNGPTTPSADLVRYLVDAGVCSTIFAQGDISVTAAGQEVLGIIGANPHILEVGNHTYHHCDLVSGSPSDPDCPDGHASAEFLVQELRAANDVIANATGMSTVPYWRPPFGAYDNAVIDAAASAGYTRTFHWSIDTRDWEHVIDGGPTTQEMVDQVVSQATHGSIVLMHVGGWNTPEAVPLMVQGLRDRGFVVTSLSDMLND